MKAAPNVPPHATVMMVPMTDFAFEPCGPDCTCAEAEDALTDIMNENAAEATFDLSDRVLNALGLAADDALVEAYQRGFNNGVRDALDALTILSENESDGLADGEYPEDEEDYSEVVVKELLDLVNTDLGTLEQKLEAWAPGVDDTLAELNRWAPNIDEDLDDIFDRHNNLSDLTAQGFLLIAEAIEKLDARVKEVEDNQEADATYLDALGTQVEDLGRKIGEGVYLR